MIGYDWPVSTVAASYLQVMNLVEDFLGKYRARVRNAVP